MKRRACLGLAAGALCVPLHARVRGTQILHMPAASVGVWADPIPLHLHLPPAWTPEAPLIVVMHGRQRNAAEYLEGWRALADRHGVAVVVPEFSEAKFPGRGWYSFGGVTDARGRPQPRERWVLGVVDQAVEWLRNELGVRHRRYALFGHSGGAQFAHRYALLAAAGSVGAQARIVVVANAGSYTVPDLRQPFPWGLGGTGLGEADMRALYARPLVVLLGDADTDPQHPSLPQDAPARAQGPHRLARGEYFFRQAQRHAQSLQAPLAWRLIHVPGVDHDGARMAPVAMDLILTALNRP